MASKTVSRAEFAALTARLALIEEQLAELQSAPTAKKVKKTAPADGVKKPVSPWLAFCTRVTELLKEDENADAKTAVGTARLAFCSHLKGACKGEYDTLTDDAILEHALFFVAPEKVAKPKTPPKKKAAAAAEEAAPPAPKKKAVKKAAPPSPAPNPFAEEGDF
jgi:negative regulator of replication initiation